MNVSKIVFLFMIAVIALTSCGGSTGGDTPPQQQNSSSYFPLYEGMSANYSEGDAITYAPWHFIRSDVAASMVSENVLRIESTLNYNDYQANCFEEHTLEIDGDSILLSRSTVTVQWDDEDLGTWENEWEYDPPVTLVANRNSIEAGDIVTEVVTITFSGEPFKIVNTVTLQETYYPAPEQPVDFIVTVVDGGVLTLGDGDVDTFEFWIDWINGEDALPGSSEEKYAVFDGFSILAAGFRLAEDKGIVAFGEGVIKE